MASDPVLDPEIIMHLFATTTGSRAQRSFEQLRRIWYSAVELLELTNSLQGYPDRLPNTIGASGPVAIRQHPTRQIQLVVRQGAHDVLLLSLWIHPTAGQGWAELDKLLDDVLGTDAESLLGVQRLFVGKVADDIADLSTAGPWPAPGSVTADGSCSIWELEPGGDAMRMRRIGMLARQADDIVLSQFAWWQDDLRVPPFARYLLHAVRLRDQFLIWDNGSHTNMFRIKTDRLLAQLRDGPVGESRRSLVEQLRQLAADIGTAAGKLAELELTVEMVTDNLTNAVAWAEGPDALNSVAGEDVRFARRFLARIKDDQRYLEAVAAQAAVWRELDFGPAEPPTTAVDSLSRLVIRLGFMIDVVGYGRRTTLEKGHILDRLAPLFENVFDRLHVDRRQRVVLADGDQTIGLFPTDTELIVALPDLIETTAQLLAADNRRYRDQIVLRMSIEIGMAAKVAHGFQGELVTELKRLVDSTPLRAVAKQPDCELAVVLGDVLHRKVVRGGYPMRGLEFQQAEVTNKEYDGNGWIVCASRKSG